MRQFLQCQVEQFRSGSHGWLKIHDRPVLMLVADRRCTLSRPKKRLVDQALRQLAGMHLGRYFVAKIDLGFSVALQSNHQHIAEGDRLIGLGRRVFQRSDFRHSR